MTAIVIPKQILPAFQLLNIDINSLTIQSQADKELSKLSKADLAEINKSKDILVNILDRDAFLKYTPTEDITEFYNSILAGIELEYFNKTLIIKLGSDVIKLLRDYNTVAVYALLRKITLFLENEDAVDISEYAGILKSLSKATFAFIN